MGLDEGDPANTSLDPALSAQDLPELPAQVDVTFSEKAASTAPWMRYAVRGVAALALITVGLAFYALYATSNPSEATPVLTNNAPQSRPRAKHDELSLPGDVADGAQPTASSSAQPRATSALDTTSTSTFADTAGSTEIARLAPDGVPPALDPSETPAGNTPDWWSGTSGSVPANGSESSTDLTAALEGRPAADRMESWMRTHAGTAWPGLDTAPEVRVTPVTDHPDLFGAPQAGAANDPHAVVAVPTSRRFKDPVATNSKSKLRRATAEDLAGLWEGNTIPMEAIDASTRLLTPAVGRVRAILKGGEVFEGRLYAVGQSMIWLDNDLGRMALLEEQIDKIDQLASVAGTPTLGERGSQELSGLPRVRVRTPGGMFYGKTIARTESTITLITDEGARVMLDSTDVEPAPLNQTVVVRPNKH